MRVCLHDFSGHPFQAELARRLADRGHAVVHSASAQYVSGKGLLERTEGDAATLEFARVGVARPFAKYTLLDRARWELGYGRATIDHLRSESFTALISCNIPLLANFRVARWARRHDLPFVFWHQDVYSAGIGDELHARFPRPLAVLGTRVFTALEAYCARNAEHVVAIGDAFTETYGTWGVDPARVSVIPNWAPLADIVPTARDNHRSIDLFPDDGLRLLYAGTLGRKHNPDLLVDLLRGLREAGTRAQLTVVSEGESADRLAAVGAEEPDLGLRVMGFQPAQDLTYVLGSADVLITLLEPDATRFSIPSKVLSYVAAGRPILGLMPADNPAAVDIVSTGGHVATPDAGGIEGSVAWLRDLTPESIADIGDRARAVAEEKFDIERVTDRFEEILFSTHR